MYKIASQFINDNERVRDFLHHVLRNNFFTRI